MHDTCICIFWPPLSMSLLPFLHSFFIGISSLWRPHQDGLI